MSLLIPKPKIIHAEIQTDKRVIFVGDIHGCIEEFMEILSEVNYSEEHDVLIACGDLVDKGPYSFETLKWFYERRNNGNVFAIRGNHDNEMIQYVLKKNPGDPVPPLYYYVKDIPDYIFLWILELPYTIRIGNVVAVHAGLCPNVPLLDQDLWNMCYMRGVSKNENGSFNVYEHLTDPSPTPMHLWATVYQGPEFVVFGHDSKRAIQKEKYALGIDTGCCYGDYLTAAVFPNVNVNMETASEGNTYRVLSVKAKHNYYPHDQPDSDSNLNDPLGEYDTRKVCDFISGQAKNNFKLESVYYHLEAEEHHLKQEMQNTKKGTILRITAIILFTFIIMCIFLLSNTSRTYIIKISAY